MTAFKHSIEWSYIKNILWWISSVSLLIILLVEMINMYKELYGMRHAIKLAKMQSNSSTSNVSSNKSSSSNPADHQHTKTTTCTKIPEKETPPKLLYILPMLSYIFYFLLGLSSIIETYHGYNDCATGSVLGTSFYGLAKMFMYLVFIYRIYVVYSNPFYGYNIKVIFVLGMTVLIWSIISTTITSIFTTGERVDINGHWFCIGKVTIGLVISTLLFDFIISTLCLFLFIRPLLSLRKTQGIEDQDKIKMYRVILKYTILSMVAILSTFMILVFIAVYDLTGLITIDIVINSMCIMHFNQRYNKSYKILYCCPIYCISTIIRMKEQNKVNQKEADLSDKKAVNV